MPGVNNHGFKLLACFLGFSLFWGWRFMYYYTDILMVIGGHDISLASMIKNLDFFFQFIVLVVVVICFVRDYKPLISDRALMIVAALFGTVSTPLITLSGALSEPAWMALSAIGWVFRGIAGSALTCLWAKVYCSVSERNACLYIALSLALGTLIVLVVGHLPFMAALIITTLIPLATTLIFDVARKNIEYRPQRYKQMLNWENARVFPTAMVHLLVAVALVSAVFGALTIVMAVNQSGTTLFTGRISTLAPGAAGVALALVIYYSPKMSSIGRLYTFAIPLFVVGALAYLIAGPSLHGESSFAMVFGFMLFDTIVWVVLIDGALRHNYPILGAFILGRAANVLGMCIGRTFACSFLDHLLADYSLAIPCAIVIVAILVFTSEQVLSKVTMFPGENLSDEIPKADIDWAELGWEGGRFGRAIAAVSEEYGLSKRETEVLEHLAKGKSAKQIQEALVVSSHTVNAHTYHIYQKCGVHKKSEIQDLVESFIPNE